MWSRSVADQTHMPVSLCDCLALIQFDYSFIYVTKPFNPFFVKPISIMGLQYLLCVVFCVLKFYVTGLLSSKAKSCVQVGSIFYESFCSIYPIVSVCLITYISKQGHQFLFFLWCNDFLSMIFHGPILFTTLFDIFVVNESSSCNLWRGI